MPGRCRMLDKIKTITVREYKATVRTKTFLVSMILETRNVFVQIGRAHV